MNVKPKVLSLLFLGIKTLSPVEELSNGKSGLSNG